MANRQWLEEVKRQLIDNKLPPRYIQRFMEELSDHFEDLMEETMNKEKNNVSPLGEPSQVAEAATVAYRQRTFFGRHPIVKFLAFGVSPMFAMVLALGIAFLGILLCGELFDYFGIDKPLGNSLKDLDSNVLKWGITTIILILPTMLLAILYCRWARRSKVDKKWMLVSCGILSALSLLIICQLTISETPDKTTHGTFSIGAGFGLETLRFSALRYTQMFVPLVVGLWFMYRNPKNQIHDKEEPLRAAA